MQTGSIEIININVNEAVMDTKKNVDDYKKEWFNQVEQDSKNLFLIAEDAIKTRPDLKIDSHFLIAVQRILLESNQNCKIMPTQFWINFG
jgi:hypothetical protein